MGWFNDKFVSAIDGVLGKFVADKNKKLDSEDMRRELAHELATMSEKLVQEEMLANLEINKVEAAHKSIFVAGWRPAVGWICVLGLANTWLVVPGINAVLLIVHGSAEGSALSVATLDTGEMMPLLLTLLGMGSLRTFEKAKGVQREV
jgi:hypothetical protein